VRGRVSKQGAKRILTSCQHRCSFGLEEWGSGEGGIGEGNSSTEDAGHTGVRRSGVRADVGTMWADRGTGRDDGCSSNSRESSCKRGRGNLTQS